MLLCSFIATFMAFQVMIKVIKSHASEHIFKSHFLPPMQNFALHNELECTLNNCFHWNYVLEATNEDCMIHSSISFNNLEIRTFTLTKSGLTLSKIFAENIPIIENQSTDMSSTTRITASQLCLGKDCKSIYIWTLPALANPSYLLLFKVVVCLIYDIHFCQT